MHGTEQLTPGYSFQGKLSGGPCLSLLPQLGNQGHHLSPPSGEVDIFPQRNSVLNIDIDRPGAHLTRGLETPLIPIEKRVIHDEVRLVRKRKVWSL